MALEIPHDQIRELQISLRKEAGLESYNPDSSELPDLPSFEDAISELVPSPAYLCCKHCKGTLLRGINSVICVFCGRQQNKDVPPDPIKFTSTSGCRWFLHSLDLDGSELVAQCVEASESNRGQMQEIELPLSSLLDLEIKWPSQSEKIEINVSGSATAQKLRNLNLAGVDLDNFFTEAKVDSVPTSTEEQFAMNRHDNASGKNASQGHGNLSLFESVKPSVVSGNSFSTWEANFQTAGSGTQHQEPKLSDPFIVSSSIDLSTHMDSVFGSGKALFDEKRNENSSSSSNMNDWFEGGTWSNSSAGVGAKEDQFEVSKHNKDQETMGKTNDSSSMDVDWFQGNQCQTTTSSSRATDNRSIVEDDDSFDDWNDFKSSTNAEVPSSNSLKDVNPTAFSVEQASEIDLFGGTNNLKDDFSSFSQPDFISTTFNNQNNSKEMNTMVPESSVSDRMVSMNGTGGSAEVDESGNFLNGGPESKAGDVEKLMAQMHDISFMLESYLSVPQKKDPEKIDLFSSFPKD